MLSPPLRPLRTSCAIPAGTYSLHGRPPRHRPSAPDEHQGGRLGCVAGRVGHAAPGAPGRGRPRRGAEHVDGAEVVGVDHRRLEAGGGPDGPAHLAGPAGPATIKLVVGGQGAGDVVDQLDWRPPSGRTSRPARPACPPAAGQGGQHPGRADLVDQDLQAGAVPSEPSPDMNWARRGANQPGRLLAGSRSGPARWRGATRRGRRRRRGGCGAGRTGRPGRRGRRRAEQMGPQRADHQAVAARRARRARPRAGCPVAGDHVVHAGAGPRPTVSRTTGRWAA